MRTTGIRLRNSAHNSFGVVVTIVKLRTRSPTGERQVSHNPGHTHQAPVGQSDRVRLLASGGFSIVKAVERHEAASPLERLAEGWVGVGLLGPGIDGQEADLDIFGPVRD
ncbi:MAG: hypothetical protein WA633_13735 [Stellaceae bacterium]